MTTETKNTTPVERRIARRAELAETLRAFAGVLNRHGYEARAILDAATELLIANTETLVAQPWATDDNPRPSVDLCRAMAANILLHAAKDIDAIEQNEAKARLDELIQRDVDGIRDAMKRDPVETGRTTVTVGAMNIPGRREPGITLQAGADGRLAPEPVVTDAMVERAVDGWFQWWNGYTGPQGPKHSCAAMRHALEQALGVRL